jgi:RNA polymerase sigma-70 factor (ECF subfamily)
MHDHPDPTDHHVNTPNGSQGPSPSGEGPSAVSARKHGRAQEPQAATLDAEAFESLRRYLFSIAYRMLGSATEAEDIVQDAYLRARDVRQDEVQSLKAYLSTVVTRLCLDHLRSAKAQREVYTGPWLPEPVLTNDLTALPAEATEQADEISLAFMLLLERLTPEERATYVLREAFAYPFDEIGAVLGKSSAAVRQLSHRAKEHLAAGGTRFTASPETQRQLAERFIAASRVGDIGALTSLLAENATGWGDGGAARQAARRPTVGRDAIVRLTASGFAKWFKGVQVTFADVNGGSATLLWKGSHLEAVITLYAKDDQIQLIHTILNPEKLAHLERRLRETGHPIPA